MFTSRSLRPLCPAFLLLALTAQAQQQPAAAPDPATDIPQIPEGATAVVARVIEVKGDAEYSPIGKEDWKPVAIDDEYPQLTQLRTGIGGSVKLQIGDEEPYTALVVDPISAVVLTEIYKTGEGKHVRVGVGRGRIRAGVAEGGLRSDFTVDSPVATLSKQGTWDFGLFYERGTDRFEIFLLDRGLVDALSKITGERRSLLPREAVTQAMRRWADEAQIRRNVPIVDVLGQGDVEVAFNRIRNDGLGVLDPGQGRESILDLRDTNATNEFRNLVRDQITNLPPIILPPNQGPFLRPEGFFGTGRGDQLIRLIIDQNNFLAKNGFARPGPLTFRRSALEGWMRQGGGR